MSIPCFGCPTPDRCIKDELCWEAFDDVTDHFVRDSKFPTMRVIAACALVALLALLVFTK